MIWRLVWRRRVTGLQDVFLQTRTWRNQRLQLEPFSAVPIIEGLLAVHVHVEHPVVRAERVFIRDAETSCRHIRLACALCQACRPVHRRSTTKPSWWRRLAQLYSLPIETCVAPAINIGVWVQPVAMTDSDRAAILRASAHKHVLTWNGLSVDEDHRPPDIPRRRCRRFAQAVNHDLVVVRCLVNLAIRHQRRSKLG